MNERIKVLANRAGYNDQIYGISKEGLHKFAELIIEECADVGYSAYWDNPESVRGIHIKEKIKKHFGI